jgi:beta-alanine degradation protein BauB
MDYIDPVKVAGRHYRLLLENENVRVLEMRLPPGEKDEVHSHPRETVYFQSGGKAKIYLPDGNVVDADLPDGHVMTSEPWTHQVENVGMKEIFAIIVEDKTTLAS